MRTLLDHQTLFIRYVSTHKEYDK
ncbi:MAG: type II toxin-antitoxin system HigB family toxin [Herminiimonas sp.]|nr:type II toxin-antitoxin system HigB family toxin [Herminiimonas sp.]